MGTESVCQSTGRILFLFFLSFPFLLYYEYIYIFFLLVRYLPRVSHFDQSHPAVILRQLLVFTTLHAPHFPPSQSLIHFPLSLPQ